MLIKEDSSANQELEKMDRGKNIQLRPEQKVGDIDLEEEAVDEEYLSCVCKAIAPK